MAKPTPLTLSREATDLVSAALRHIGDAEHLLGAASGYTSPDQAYHLAGFAPECARKAVLSLRWLDKAIGHGVDLGSEALLDFAVAVDPVARRYDPLAYSSRYPALLEWRPDARYERTGRRKRPEAETLCKEARDVVDTVVVALWSDGRLPDGEPLW
jgi:hypothetical protein